MKCFFMLKIIFPHTKFEKMHVRIVLKDEENKKLV